jgi:hypothetical protein
MKKYIIPLLIFFVTGGFLFFSKKSTPTLTYSSVSTIVKVPTPPVIAMMEKSTRSYGRQPSLIIVPTPASHDPDVLPSRATVSTITTATSIETVATFWFRIGISLFGFLASLYIILSKKFEEAVNKWGYSTIGMILGFWLK